MRYYQLRDGRGDKLVAEKDGKYFDFTATNPGINSFVNLVASAEISGMGIDSISKKLLDGAKEMDGIEVEHSMAIPVCPDEVWAAGVTYRVSKKGRKAESIMPKIYRDVYESERPEIFFKSTPNRIVGPGDSVGIRGDSDWNVPEPELSVVLYYESIAGFTIGNDMSSRSIEGVNPLYLPQAKIYDRSCSIGPCVVSPSSIGNPHDLSMSMEIDRTGETVFRGSASTSEMVRSCEELVSFYCRHNSVPKISVLLTGTSIVPPDDFTLEEGDRVRITIDKIGVLENTVVKV